MPLRPAEALAVAVGTARASNVHRQCAISL